MRISRKMTGLLLPTHFLTILKAFVLFNLFTNSHAEKYNLFGKPGDGYYLESRIGTPPQSVSNQLPLFLEKKKKVNCISM